MPLATSRSLLSPAYITHTLANCLWLLTQLIRFAEALAPTNAGSSNPASRAMTTTTIKSSIRVNPERALDVDVVHTTDSEPAVIIPRRVMQALFGPPPRFL